MMFGYYDQPFPRYRNNGTFVCIGFELIPTPQIMYTFICISTFRAGKQQIVAKLQT